MLLCVCIQLLSCVQLFVTPLTAARQAPLSSTVSQGCSSSCPLSQWCYLTISSSAAPFSFCPWSFPVQFSCSVISEHLRPHGPQQDRLPCPSPTPGACSNSCPLNQWCPPTISPSVIPFSSHLQSFPALGSCQMNQFFTSGGQCIGVSASTSVLPMNTQDWSPLGWTGWISLRSKGLSRVFSNTTLQNHQFFSAQLSSQSNSHIHTWLLEKP